mgnify:CR=1 FL=1
MSEDQKPSDQSEVKETPAKTPAGARATRGAAGSKRGRAAPAGARPTRGGAAGARPTRGGAAGAHPSSTEGGDAAGAKAAAQPQQAKAQLLLKKFSPVYIVKSSVVDDICGMCRNSLDQVCNSCFAAHITDPQLCPIIQGKCLHRFHLHCIQGWLKKSTFCPAAGCGARWENM